MGIREALEKILNKPTTKILKDKRFHECIYCKDATTQLNGKVPICTSCRKKVKVDD